MLKKFLLNSLSSFVGAWLAFIVFAIASVLTVVFFIGKMGLESTEQVKSHSILQISLSGEIVEAETSSGIDYQSMLLSQGEKPQTLRDLVVAIDEAAVNKDVEAIYLKCDGVSASPATLNALRSSLQSFKKSGKKIYAYGDALSVGDYFVATTADSLFLNPQGAVALKGISGTSLFMKNFFDKIGVSFEVVKVGTFKSAVEPYISNEMSAPARAQLDTLYGQFWSYICKEISARRGISPATLNTLINRDNLPLRNAKFALDNKLVDRLIYERSIKPILGRLVGKDPDKLNIISPETLAGESDWGNDYNSDKQIAVLYATGEIAENTKNGIDCYTLVPQIVKLADDDKVKGLVLRVNSPGGSVFGSDQIGEALDYFQSKGKPLAVSMGDYAASGGYWISCHADRIFADPLTVTGSIGIFGLIPNISALAQKVGITPQMVSTNPGAQFPSLFYPMTPEQHAAMQNYVEEGYAQFINRVATGRKCSESKIRAIAEGRVWSAETAVKIGLVDQLGSLRNAIDWVAKKAGIENKYGLSVYPSRSNNFWAMLSESGIYQENLSPIYNALAAQLPDKAFAYVASRVIERKPVLALMPALGIKL